MNTQILVIEDDRFNRQLYQDLLQSEGWSVVLAASAGEGLAAARRVPPALVVMDLELPDVDGIKATRVLRADAKTAKVPVLVVSAHAQQGQEARVREAGATAFLPKPLVFSEFLAVVRSLVATTPHKM